MTSPEAHIRAAADSAHERSPIRAAQRERNLARFGVPDYPGGQLGEWAALPVEQAVAVVEREQDGAVARARARMKKDPVFTEPERVWDPATKRWVG